MNSKLEFFATITVYLAAPFCSFFLLKFVLPIPDFIIAAISVLGWGGMLSVAIVGEEKKREF